MHGIALVLLLPGCIPITWAACPDDQPAECNINNQFAGGKWDLSQLTGQYDLNGNERFCEFPDDGCELMDDYDPVSGTLTIERLGGMDENFIDVACDGSVTGQGHERISGTIDKSESVQWDYPDCFGGLNNEVATPANMSWNVTIERNFTITGNVTGSGVLDLDYEVTTATLDVDGTFAFGTDCIWWEHNHTENGIDISGDTEEVQLSGSFNAESGTWDPTQTPRNGKSWMDDVLHRVKLNAENMGDQGMSLSPSLQGPGATQPGQQGYLEYFIQDSVTVNDDISINAEPQTPFITNMQLTEPQQYLQDVAVNTDVEVMIDWYGQSPDQVEFTYGSTTETVSGSDSVTWFFDAGESGDTIEAVAIHASERSEPYVLAVPKVTLPSWAGTSTDWSGQAGIQYDATLDWPITLEATRTVDTISLFTGLWGISGDVSSDYQSKANSDGSPGSGEMSTSADFKAAGKSFSFDMEGPTNTTLSCDSLETDGEGTVSVPLPSWQKTLNPATAIPGLQAGVCAISSFLCSVINSVGIKASAQLTVSGTGVFEGLSGDMMWTGGRIGGSLTATVGAGASLPGPLDSVANVSVSGSGTGCMEIEVAPSPSMTQLGGSLDLNATASLLGQSTSASESWPFGDSCGRRAAPDPGTKGIDNAFVPADGRLDMAHRVSNDHLQGIAVWSALPAGQSRPSGDIQYRFYDQQNDSWGTTGSITQDIQSDSAPGVAYDAHGNVLIVYQRSEGTLPTDIAQLPVFANLYEIHWALVDASTEQVIDSGQLTNNSMTDFGATLIADTNGELSLFWQRGNGIEITGTVAEPVEILQMSWDASLQQWDTENSVATNLSYTYGWSAAAFSATEQVLGLIIDGDQNYMTANDRELYRFRKAGGTWGLGEAITNDGVGDDAVLTGFTAQGDALLLWRKADLVQELAGSLPGAGFPLENTAALGGVGDRFAHGRLAVDGNNQITVWPQNVSLRVETRIAGNSATLWDVSTLLEPDLPNHLQTIHSLTINGPVAWYGWATQAPGGGGFETLVTPRFSRLPAFDSVFENGFE